MDHTTCVSVTVGRPPVHPFKTLDEVCKSPVGFDHFRSYLADCSINLSSHYPDVPPSDLKVATQNDLSFYSLYHMVSSDHSISNLRLVLEMLQTYVITANHFQNNGVLLSPQFHDQIANNMISGLQQVHFEVSKRLEFIFKHFKHSDFMKFGCFQSQ